jgi:hypothetical protein
VVSRPVLPLIEGNVSALWFISLFDACRGHVLQVTRQLSTQRRQWFMGNSTAARLHSRQCVELGSRTSFKLTQQRLLCTPVGSSTPSSSRRAPTAHQGAPAQRAT